MISFFISLAVLFVGFMLYGRFAEHIFTPDDRLTPANEINDGVDCIPMKP
jgi:carbon starvation protein CstA